MQKDNMHQEDIYWNIVDTDIFAIIRYTVKPETNDKFLWFYR